MFIGDWSLAWWRWLNGGCPDFPPDVPVLIFRLKKAHENTLEHVASDWFEVKKKEVNADFGENI